MYQSLHTTVIGPAGERIEVQIRTARDAQDRRGGHRRALGVQGEGARREGRRGALQEGRGQFGWLRQLMEWQKELEGPERVPRDGEGRPLLRRGLRLHAQGRREEPARAAPRRSTSPTPSTPRSASSCVGAKVNGKIVPLRYKLKNGDTVEILTSPHSHPSKDWLTFVKTSRAQARIRQFIRQAEHRRSIEIGREVAEREFRRFGLNLNKVQKGGELEKAAERARLPHRRRPARRRSATARCAAAERAPAARPGRRSSPSRSPAAERRRRPARITEIFRKVARPPATERRAHQRHRRRAGPLRPLLQPGAGRRDRRASSPAAAASPCTPRPARRRSASTPSAASTSPGT